MVEWLGTSLSVFFVLTVVLMGGAGFMTGQALAAAWRPVWQLFLYSLLLGAADRFLSFALFQGELLSFTAYLFDTAVIAAIALIAFRLTRARRMVSQYPWLYERRGPFSWRERRP
jgi:hypothetical protein